MRSDLEIPALMLSITWNQFKGALRHYVAMWLILNISEPARRWVSSARDHIRLLGAIAGATFITSFNIAIIGMALRGIA